MLVPQNYSPNILQQGPHDGLTGAYYPPALFFAQKVYF